MEEYVKKIINLKDSNKILIVYFITTVVSMAVSNLVVEYDYNFKV